MVITEKVQETVNKKEKNLVRKAYISGLCITYGRFHGNHDIAQQIWLDICPISFRHREGNYVSWTVTMQILAIDRRYLVIIHENQTDFLFPAVKE